MGVAVLLSVLSRPGRESVRSSAEFKNGGAMYGLVLNYLSTGTILLLLKPKFSVVKAQYIK
jgi:hypothetical protein